MRQKRNKFLSHLAKSIAQKIDRLPVPVIILEEPAEPAIATACRHKTGSSSRKALVFILPDLHMTIARYGSDYRRTVLIFEPSPDAEQLGFQQCLEIDPLSGCDSL